MNLNQLYYFQVLAKHQHYTLASKELYISQPSLTYAIKELEKELGVSLFDKRGRNIFLNTYGKTFLEYVNQSLETLDHGIQAMKTQSHDELQTIHISVIPTVVSTYLAPIIKKINEINPNIQINFRSEKTLEVIQGVKDHKYDFGICSKLNNDSLHYLPLLHEELVLIVSKDHPLSKKKKVTFKDMIQYPFITYQKEISIYKVIMNLFEKENLTPQVLYQLDDETSIASMVSQDFGIAIIAYNELIKPIKDIEIIHLDIDFNSRIIYLAFDPQYKMSSTASHFIDYIISNEIDL
ncbi:MAG: LysR family transcriptional regulator [Coprobacillus sp.]